MDISQIDQPISRTDKPTSQRPLRLWPGIALVALQWLLWFVVPIFSRDTGIIAVLGGAACGLAVVVWWLFFSRAPWSEMRRPENIDAPDCS